jgi:carboxylesterase type B
MLTNGGNTEGLFHGAFMQSGFPLPVGDITHGQKDYDIFAQNAGCPKAGDTLECLRNVPASTFQAAVDKSRSVSSNTVCISFSPE